MKTKDIENAYILNARPNLHFENIMVIQGKTYSGVNYARL